ncbi:hypothetical protein EVB32_113 [Rhizobium phage RHph_TM39]|uniref:Uncharacterized protein n=1 Tax=Rhizobium phage RHph_TM30 TaxID=2509764 RepID=A0A7S5UUK4_9CAUD|nr:hypothetical protein PQC16_gp113 [Rhizobium phage RHph_TM30]QIG71584.1 hypothetical protein EVB94_113 [Rhizobium phage RHph_TM40]QIG71947.1 hypothetical protein EVB95_113 [Rhizobium phage RHph_TM2_3B]QIG72309.1 hypothetical protein EVB96_113 [Rhizobium phage RHph_TM3_3_6]QIG77101.1 hypothetical protein EVB32_113 [Rhizobium phage RHph_TM39]QIG77439.1 hypothetical protein EVB61_111 [Rhizobium phage RHph_TM21B]QIG77700.1 hypothetical protein EVB64_113 [Rhizobium phage RHph_TM61]
MTSVVAEWYNVKFVDMNEEFNFSEMSLVRRSLDISYSKIPDQKPTMVAEPQVPGLWYLMDANNQCVGQVKHMRFGSTILTEPTHF